MTIDSCKYLFLTSLTEPHEGGLRLVAEEGQEHAATKQNSPHKVLPPDVRKLLEQCTPIRHEPGSRVFTLFWPSYVAYAVENESYACICPTDESTGKVLRLYSQSAYLDYVARKTFASSTYPGPYKHWAVLCEDHIVNVVSCEDPVISITISQADGK